MDKGKMGNRPPMIHLISVCVVQMGVSPRPTMMCAIVAASLAIIALTMPTLTTAVVPEVSYTPVSGYCAPTVTGYRCDNTYVSGDLYYWRYRLNASLPWFPAMCYNPSLCCGNYSII
jgi:hypothetical protein